MGHVLVAIPAEGVQDERDLRRAASSSSSWTSCCYSPRKQSTQALSTTLPRYRVIHLTGSPGRFEFDTDTDTSLSDYSGLCRRKVRFARGPAEATLHEWLEIDEEANEARRSDDVDWDNLSEKVANVQKIGLVKSLISLPQTSRDGTKLRRRARARRKSSCETRASLGLLGHPAGMPSVAEEPCKWTKKDLEVWNPDHIKAVSLELFQRHDAGQKGRLSWQNQEVMNFVEDFFKFHGCLPPQMTPAVFSSAYSEVKLESLPSHRDADGLDSIETCKFVRRVYDFIVNDVSPPERTETSKSVEACEVAPHVCSPTQASSMLVPHVSATKAPDAV